MNGGDLNQQQQQQQQQLQQQQQWAAMQQYQQQWMAMQYPAVVMHQNMMYNQHYVPYYPHHQHQFPQPRQSNQIQSSGEDNKTIWIGDLLPWMDEAYLNSCFSQTGEVVSVKIIRNRHTGQSERYGFIEFSSHTAAETALQGYNGTTMPNADQPFRLNWAAFSGGGGDRRPEAGSDSSIFVGDLAAEVTDSLLLETFASKYPSVRGAKVVVDSSTGRSKGYGFVRFGDDNEKLRALTEMNGVLCSSRPMRISVATPKKPLLHQQQYASQGQPESDLSNTTIFVGGLDSDVSDEELRGSFIAFGEVISVKIPAGKGCGFVQFANRSSAEEAIQRLNGSVIGKQTVRLSWGRSLGNKQWNGAQYGRQNYNGYGYAGAAYGTSSNGNINNHQQPVLICFKFGLDWAVLDCYSNVCGALYDMETVNMYFYLCFEYDFLGNLVPLT
ncbi:polyadenylate-binding protein RBP47 [Striga asiatica]|uniref:Polyadenylate-binding protein RBP47 n=1 Tax=Striga asiatica TaxID=4170 RepID=A0A5A7QWV6_STRAF|nr:polyadenylate-binding protein RBP47 [Striga asiatica]